MKAVLKVSLISMICGLSVSGVTWAAEDAKGAGMAPSAKAACAWSNEAKMKEHFLKHVTYPTTGAQMKEVCRKEMPDEFTAAERSCFEGKINDKKTYKSAGEVFAELNVK
jgi:hypothetical protein